MLPSSSSGSSSTFPTPVEGSSDGRTKVSPTASFSSRSRIACLQSGRSPTQPWAALHECALEVDLRLALRWPDALPGAARQELPRPDVVGQGQSQQPIQLTPGGWALDPHERLHAPVEIAMHHVRASDQHLRTRAVAEPE